MAPSLSALRSVLLDISQPIAKRTHAAFNLRTNGSEESASIIAEALVNKNDSSLMRHELAYILGQMQHSHVCDILIRILEEESEDILVRHESAEVSYPFILISCLSHTCSRNLSGTRCHRNGNCSAYFT